MRLLPAASSVVSARVRLTHAAAAFALGLPAVSNCGQPVLLPTAAPGLVESGTPSFVVLGPAALGLSSPPTDIHVLPDGRMLVVAAQELAIGDGARWAAFRRHPDTDAVPLASVMIDRDGSIYASIVDGFARIEIGDEARWRFVRVTAFPADPMLAGRVLSRVSSAQGEWFWTAGSGALVAWHPGRAPVVLGQINDLDRPVVAGGTTFFGDPSTGAIHRVVGDRLEAFDPAANRNVNRAIVCGVPLPDGRAIVGTNNLGALLFDGRTLQPLASRGPFAGRYRINDLCATAGGFFCAALDNVGLVFFAGDGRIVQVLDRTVDHRLSRSRRLLDTGGVVWALLNEGVAQVAFPARVSNFEPFVSTGLTYAQPARHAGRLWLIADGQVQRGVYDDDGRLLHFAIDTPDPWASSIVSAGERLLVATAAGIYQREADAWKLVAGDIVNAHLGAVADDPRRWLIVAHDEVGWLRLEADEFVVERFPVPGMGSSFGTVLEAENAFWAELGTSRVARIVAQPDGRLDARVIGREHGFPDGWVQAFVVDDRIRFNVAGRTFCYDAATDRIVPDTDFLRHAPELLGENGRPARDARGRLWITANDSVRVVDDRAGGGTRSQERMPPAFTPIAFTPEAGGVVWMHQRQRLVRFDPAMPEAEPAPLRAVISHVQLVSSNRHWFSSGIPMPPLDFQNNSIVAHFLAPHSGLGRPVTFEVMLEGGDDTWVPTGTAGSASFTQLKEGNYVLRVRPRAGTETGAEATLAFSIRPPWYRTTLAYVGYVIGAAAAVFGAAAGWSLLARRKRAELERIVSERTAELRQSEERYRRLTGELEQHVNARTAELHRANDRLVESNLELEAFSYSVSHDLRAPLRNISGFAELLRKRAVGRIDHDTDRYLAIVSAESVRLGGLIDALLVFSRLNRAELNRQPLDLGALIAAVRTELVSEAAGRAIEWRIGPLPNLDADTTLLRQVFVNLLSNALKFTRGRNPAVIELGMAPAAAAPGEVVVFVRDNGAGFDPKYADKMFGVFQRLHSSREYEGSGIGLATVRRIVARHGGRAWAEGRPGTGAAFFVAFPAVATVAPPAAKGK